MYIITGFGRSGTSFVAEILNSCGFPMGEYLPAVDAGFEHPETARINKMILNGDFWADDVTVAQMQRLCRNVAIAKDPRYIFTLGIWLRYGAAIDGVFLCKRNYADIFRSSEKTNAGTMAVFNGFADEDKTRIADAVMNGFTSLCAARSIEVFPIHFPDSLENFGEIACLDRVVRDTVRLEEAWKKTRRTTSSAKTNGLTFNTANPFATPDVQYRYALKLAQNGMRDQAMKELETLVSVHPEYALAHNDLGVLTFQTGDAVTARSHYEAAVRLDPQNITFLKNLADFTAVADGKINDAVTIYQKVLSLRPDDAEALSSLGTIATALGKDDKAALFYGKVLKVLPGDPAVREMIRAARERNPFAGVNVAESPLAFDFFDAEQIDSPPVHWETGYQHYCAGKGIEIGSGGKPLPLPGTIQVDLVDDYNKFKYHVDHLAPADDLSFASDSSFDFIVHSNMLEHLGNPVKAMLEWHRVLRPSGILYMIVPDKRLWVTDRQRNVVFPSDWMHAYRENRPNRPSHPNSPDTHFFGYTLEALKECLRQTEALAGRFEIIDSYEVPPAAVDEIVKTVSEYKPDPDHMCRNYLAIQKVQKSRGVHAVGHNFHIVLRATK